MSVVRYLDTWDYVTMVTLVLASSVFGLYHMLKAKKSESSKEFVISGQNVGFLPLVLSITATSSSAIQILAFPIDSYFSGINFLIVGISATIAATLCSHLYLPVFFRLNKNTVFELLTAAVATYAPALVINQVTGLHIWTSITIIAAVCILYTSLGGFNAVIWADVLQCIVSLGVLVLLVAKGVIDTGGPEAVWENLKAGNRTEMFIWSSSPNSRYSIWLTTIGCYVSLGSFYATHQLNMQRYLSNKTLAKAKISVYGGAMGFSVCHWLYAAVGLTMYAYYHRCDPLLSGRIKVRDQSVVIFAVDVLSDYKGLNGVFIGGLMCATLSTLSSYLNMFAAVTVSDYVPVFKPHLSDDTLKIISRISVLVYGVVCVSLVVLIENMGNISNIVFGVYGILGGAVFTTFTIGMLLPWVNSKGAVCGFFGSLVLPVWSWIGSFVQPQFISYAPISADGCLNFTSKFNITRRIVQDKTFLDEFYSLTPFWFPCVSIVSGLIVAIIINYAIDFQDPRSVDPKLLFSFIKKIIYRKECGQKRRVIVNSEDNVNRPVEIPLLEVPVV